MKMIMRTILTASIMAFAAAGGAHAQAPGAAVPELPSALQCEQGYGATVGWMVEESEEAMLWNMQKFDDACIQVWTNAVPAGQRS